MCWCSESGSISTTIQRELLHHILNKSLGSGELKDKKQNLESAKQSDWRILILTSKKSWLRFASKPRFFVLGIKICPEEFNRSERLLCDILHFMNEGIIYSHSWKVLPQGNIY